jgi:Rrf2 family protein
MFSRSAEYGIRAMVYLALQPTGKLSIAKEISGSEKIPMAFLWKILHSMGRNKLVRSFRGVGGGYELARPSDQITIHDIVKATDGEAISDRCILGLPDCGEENPCPMHETWKELRGKIDEMLKRTTLATLSQSVKVNRGRLRAR